MAEVKVDSYDVTLSIKSEGPGMFLNGLSFEEAIECINRSYSIRDEYRFRATKLLKVAKAWEGNLVCLQNDFTKHEMFLTIRFLKKETMEEFICYVKKEALF